MTPEEHRAYNRGYGAGKRFAEDKSHEKRLLGLCKTYRARAERAEAGLGLGRCDQCAHWKRERQAFWGYCGFTETIQEFDQPWRGDPDQRIATKENFGCIRFEPKFQPPHSCTGGKE